MNDAPLEIPLFYRQQMEALAYVSGKSRQAVLNAVLAKALPSPATDPENLLEIAFSLQQPGDDIPALAACFREVRDAEGIPIDDHSIMLSVESMCGIISPDERALLEEAATILTTGKVLPKQGMTREEKAAEFDAMNEGEEWKQ